MVKPVVGVNKLSNSLTSISMMSSASVAAVDHLHLASAVQLRSAAASLALLSYMQGGL